MGCETSLSHSNKILSLNYSGILNSPFQFYSPQNQSQLSNISQLFQKNLSLFYKNYNKQTFKWNIGKIDSMMQKQRYSCLYNPEVGVQNGKLLIQRQFQQKWKDVFQKKYPSFKEKFQTSEEEKKEALLFDYLCYKSILDYLYGLDSKIKEQDPKKYRIFMKKYFNMPYLNESNKIKKTIKALKQFNISICFLMEINQNLINELKKEQEFHLIYDNKITSIIILRKSKFNKILTNQQTKDRLKELYKELFWNEDSLVGVVDDTVIISAHLSSKKQKNQKQVKQMLQDLTRLKNKKINFIVGIDANSQIKKYVDKLQINLNYFPLNNQITSFKQRTFLQPQANKANLKVQKSGDFLISSFKILQTSQVQNIQGKSVRLVTPMLPTSSHPYDHFAIVCDIDITEMTFSNKKNA